MMISIFINKVFLKSAYFYTYAIIHLMDYSII